MQARSTERYNDQNLVQYNVRNRRRLRPATGELLPQQVAAARALAEKLPTDTAGPSRNVLLDRPVIERVLPRAKRDSWQR